MDAAPAKTWREPWPGGGDPRKTWAGVEHFAGDPDLDSTSRRDASAAGASDWKTIWQCMDWKLRGYTGTWSGQRVLGVGESSRLAMWNSHQSSLDTCGVRRRGRLQIHWPLEGPLGQPVSCFWIWICPFWITTSRNPWHVWPQNVVRAELVWPFHSPSLWGVSAHPRVCRKMRSLKERIPGHARRKNWDPPTPGTRTQTLLAHS